MQNLQQGPPLLCFPQKKKGSMQIFLPKKEELQFSEIDKQPFHLGKSQQKLQYMQQLDTYKIGMEKS